MLPFLFQRVSTWVSTRARTRVRERSKSKDPIRESMCSLEEAFTTFSEPEPRNADIDKKRRKKRRAFLPPPEPLVIEPDRPAHRPLPPAELLGGGPTENRSSTSISGMLNALEGAEYFPHPSSDVDNSSVYNLEPDWAKTFNDSSAPDWIKERMPQRNAETPLIPSPWLDGSSTLWQKTPESQRTQVDLGGAAVAAESRIDDMQRKLDQMFKKMNDLEITRSESNHLEIILFVLGGIFLLLMLDLLVKQGTQASMLLAAAGGTMSSFGNGSFGSFGSFGKNGSAFTGGGRGMHSFVF